MGGPTQPGCIDDRLRKGDRELFSVFGHPVSVNEAHSGVLGASAGFVIGERQVAFKTIMHEPWYFAGLFAIGYAVGKLVARN